MPFTDEDRAAILDIVVEAMNSRGGAPTEPPAPEQPPEVGDEQYLAYFDSMSNIKRKD